MKKKIYGKWILCGEHSVLRGHPAIAFPLGADAFYLDVEYKSSSFPLKIIISGTFKKDLERSLSSFLNLALEKVKARQTDLKGELIFTNELPFGAGLGGSSVLCLALSHIFFFKKWIQEEEVKDFAMQLEHHVHSNSSGIDINVCFENKPILYQNGKVQQIISTRFHPLIYLSDLGLRSSTSTNVKQVEAEFKKDLKLNQERDRRMSQATQLSLEALSSQDKEVGFKKITQAFELAASCFRDWNLISSEAAHYMQQIKELGALGVKPTGSGGGVVLSLWDKQPPEGDIKWIPLKL